MNRLEQIIMKRFLIPIAAISVLLASCSEKKDASKATEPVKVEKPKTEHVKVQTIARHQLENTIDLSSSLIAFEENYLAPATPGRIEKIYVEVGDKVKKGDVLVQMDRTQLYQAKVQLQSLETDFHRMDTLYQVGSIAKQQYDQLKTQYDIAKSNVAFLSENTTLIAPYTGVVSGKFFENGEMYSGAPNTQAGKAAVVSMVQIDKLKAVVNLSEKYFPQIEKGMQARVNCDIYPEEQFDGEVYRIYPTIDPTTRSFQVEVKINNAEELLRPGMFARVNLNLGDIDVISIPSIAILKVQGANDRYVFLERNGKAKRVSVSLGKRYNDRVEILNGNIKAGDKLIVAGQSRLMDGVAVQVVK